MVEEKLALHEEEGEEVERPREDEEAADLVVERDFGCVESAMKTRKEVDRRCSRSRKPRLARSMMMPRIARYRATPKVLNHQTTGLPTR